MRRTILIIAGLLLIGLVSGAVTLRNAERSPPVGRMVRADPSPPADLPPRIDPTKENCVAAVKRARSLAAALPAADLSRYFAERDIHQAMTEAGIGEFDDCLEWAARATDEVQERRHTLQPGETLKIRRANE